MQAIQYEPRAHMPRPWAPLSRAVFQVQRANLVTAWPAPVIVLPNWRHHFCRPIGQVVVHLSRSVGVTLQRLVGMGVPAGLVPVPPLVAAGRGALSTIRRRLARANGNRSAWRTK